MNIIRPRGLRAAVRRGEPRIYDPRAGSPIRLIYDVGVSGLSWIAVFCCRILAVRRDLVQRVRDVRRARVLREHNAHVLHLAGPLSGHPESAADEAHRHQTDGRLQDRGRLAARHVGL